MQEIIHMKKSIHWFINYIVAKKGTSGSFMFLSLWSIGKFHPRSGILVVLYRHTVNKKIILKHSLTFKFLMLIVWNNLPESSMFKLP